MNKTPGPWSYSGIKLYDTCPRKYQSEKVTKEVPFKDTTATLYGKEIHTAERGGTVQVETNGKKIRICAYKNEL